MFMHWSRVFRVPREMQILQQTGHLGVVLYANIRYADDVALTITSARYREAA